jgi:hypothetical protein
MKRRLRLMPEWSTFPVWAEDGMVKPDALAISDELRRDLQAWNDEYTDTGGVAPDEWHRARGRDEEPWREQANALARRIESELGPDVEVTVRLWN